MRVLLVQALSMEESNSLKVYPIGIVTLATHLSKRGHRVKLLDMNMEPDAFGALKKELLSFSPDAVGVSLRNIDPLANKTSSLVPMFKVLVRFIAKSVPNIPIISGGAAFSLFPKRLMTELPEIRYGLAGESEYTLPLLLENIENPPPLPGLFLRNGIETQKPEYSFDMGGYLVPDRSLLDPSPYIEGSSYVPAIGVETLRGCPYNCAYCVYPKLQGSKIRKRKAGDIADEIAGLYEEFGISRVHFNDPVANMRSGNLEAVCEELLVRGLKIRWGGFLREDTLTRENVGLFVRSGCECFAFSPDGMSGHALNILGKDITTDHIIRAAELTSPEEILSVYHFMVNVPGDVDATISEGKALIHRLYDIYAKNRNLGTIVFNNMRIMPGTELERVARDQAVIDENTDLLYPTYYNPRPYDKLRYELEALHNERNVLSWHGVH